MRVLIFTILGWGALAAETVKLTEPDADRWMYFSNSTPGKRAQAATFTALPADDTFDDRFGFYLIRFATSEVLPAGLPLEYYRVKRASMTAVIGVEMLFSYDPTPDPWQSIGTPTVPATIADEDPGRPLELFGAGFRNGFTAANFTESSAHGGSNPGIRNAFPFGSDAAGIPADVSNNISHGFDAIPWAIGRNSSLTPGDAVPVETQFTFEIDLSLPGTSDYLRQSLHEGRLWLTLSSLHPAIQQGGEFVAWLTRDDSSHQIFGDLAPALTLEVEIAIPLEIDSVPERDSIRLTWPQLAGFRYTLHRSELPDGNSALAVHSEDATVSATATIELPREFDRAFFYLEVQPLPPEP